MSQWVVLSQDRDPATRAEAVAALMSLRDSPQALAALSAVARHEQVASIRLDAAHIAAIRDADAGLAALRITLDEIQAGNVFDGEEDKVRLLLVSLGTQARQAKGDLQQAQAKADRQQDREMLGRLQQWIF